MAHFKRRLLLAVSVLLMAAGWAAAADPPADLSHRQATLVVRADPGAAVKVEQIEHAFAFGTAVSSHAFDGQMAPAERERYLNTLRENFNTAVHENALKWYATQPERDVRSYETADAILAWCAEHAIGMRGHTIFWSKPWRVQDWVKELDDEALREAVEARVKEVVGRYRGRIDQWDVNNEMLDADFFEQRLGEDIRGRMFVWGKEANPDAVLFVNENDILTGNEEKLARYEALVQGLLDAGAPVGGLGLQGHFEEAPDPAYMKKALDRLARFGLPIVITEFDILTADEAVKAKALEDVYRTAFAHPAVEGVLMWGFWGGKHWLNSDNAIPGYTALWDQEWEPMPAAEVYRGLVFDEWWTRAEGVADETGVFRTEVFLGTHRVTAGGRETTVEAATPGAVVEVELRGGP